MTPPPSPARGGSLARGCLVVIGALALMALAAGGAFWLATRWVDRQIDPDPVTVASASLQGLREQNRLSAFVARYVAVVTSSQSRLGLTAQKTLIMPGMVRYEVDLGKLDQGDVKWDAGTRTLSVKLPPIELVGPQVDLTAIREYGGDGLLTKFTDAEARLDTANRRAGQAELVRQAREPVPMRLARDATRRAIERSFAMPLRAAGINAKVDAWFPDERPGIGLERWDTTRSVEEVLGNRR
ncbi:DUF4230 domain-containing protein [Sphingomonas sp. DT-204]|uniref:DUF4230 domain-containing protein n=1 Tax=Sphingomonas sp. DT-204 TaxID=3396166 RepID=UPI003F1A2F2D